MLTLYHAPRSRSSRILWLLEELGAEYDITYVDIQRRDDTGVPDPRNPHPDKKVPALVHDGVLITESTAIILYLTDLYPKAGLAPVVGDAQRGPYLSWLAYYAGVMEPLIALSFFGVADNPGLRHTFRGRDEMDHRLLTALGEKPYLLGDTFSAADLLVASIGQWARAMLPDDELVDNFLARCNARPALSTALKKDAPPEAAGNTG